MLCAVILAVAAAAPCRAPTSDEALLLVVAEDPLAPPSTRARLEDALRASGWSFLPAEASAKALGDEGGAIRRGRILADNRDRIRRAEALFRELEDEAALELVSDVTTELVGIHQEPGAVELLARAHLLAGAIYVARNRLDAGRARLQRALDLDPDLAPATDRYSPRVMAELASLRQSEDLRSKGDLVLELNPPLAAARIYLDGRRWTPSGPDARLSLGEGPHLIRVSAPGYTSHLGTVRVRPFEVTEVGIRLIYDPIVQRLSALHARLRGGQNVEPLLEELSGRSGADRTVVSWVHVASSGDGQPDGALGASIIVEDVGRATTPTLDAEQVRFALARAMSCADQSPDWLSPALVYPNGGQISVEAGPSARWYEKPWFWAVVGTVIVGTTAAVVAARVGGGPPDNVDVDLVPRPVGAGAQRAGPD